MVIDELGYCFVFIDRDKLFRDLWHFLQKIESRWTEFADHLGIDKGKINTIRANCLGRANNEDSCREMLIKWHDSTTRATRKWSTIKEAAKGLQLKGLVQSLKDAGVDGMKYHICCASNKKF